MDLGTGQQTSVFFAAWPFLAAKRSCSVPGALWIARWLRFAGAFGRKTQEGTVDPVNALEPRHEVLAHDASRPDHLLRQTVARACQVVAHCGGAREPLAGRFRNYIVSGDRGLEMRSTWLVTTRVPETAQMLRMLLGGDTPTSGGGEGGGAVAVTAAEKVAITIDSVESISFDMKQWIDGRLAHHCDTRVLLSPDEEAGTLCGCPASVADLKARAAADHGPRPDVRVHFRLTAAPELGIFEYRTSGWTLLTDHVFNLHTLLSRMAESGRPALCSLEIELVRYTTKFGREVSFRRVCLRPVGSSELASGVSRRLRAASPLVSGLAG